MLRCFVICIYINKWFNNAWRNVGILLYHNIDVDMLCFILEEEDETYHNLQDVYINDEIKDILFDILFCTLNWSLLNFLVEVSDCLFTVYSKINEYTKWNRKRLMNPFLIQMLSFDLRNSLVINHHHFSTNKVTFGN